MRHWILTLFFAVSCVPCVAQDNLVSLSAAQTAARNFTFNLFSLDVQTTDIPIEFANGEDFSRKKVIPGYYRITVKSSGAPWIVMAALAEPAGGSMSGYPASQASLVSLRCAGFGEAVKLSTVPQVILRSNNNLTNNVFYVDLIIDPPFEHLPGSYPQTVNFQLAQQ